MIFETAKSIKIPGSGCDKGYSLEAKKVPAGVRIIVHGPKGGQKSVCLGRAEARDLITWVKAQLLLP